MINIVWTIVRKNNKFLLVRRSLFDTYGGLWVFPGGHVDPKDQTIVDAAARELKEEAGVIGQQFNLLCKINVKEYLVHFFYCTYWYGKPKPTCKDIINTNWFTLAEIHSFPKNLSPLIDQNLMYLSYLIQHYDCHPDEWDGV